MPPWPTATYWPKPLITAFRLAVVPLARWVQVVPSGLVSTAPPLPVAKNWLELGLTANKLAVVPDVCAAQVTPLSMLRTTVPLSPVATPEVVAYATYPAGPMFRRADVVTREVPKSLDLAAALGALSRSDSKHPLIAATGKLLASLSAAGARHPDLNIKNILIADNDYGGVEAYALDVDRVWFDTPGKQSVLEANLRRLSRSAVKWRRMQALPIEEADLLAIESSALELLDLAR